MGEGLNLSCLLPLLPQLAESGRVAVIGAARAPVLASLRQNSGRGLLVVVPGPERARGLLEQLSLWLPPGTPLYLFPEPDGLPFERLAPDPATVQERLRVLQALKEAREGGPAPVVVASAWALVSRTIPYPDFARACHTLKVGMRVEREALLARWEALGYTREGLVEVPGTISGRGGILDIFPPGSPHPFRLELWGNEIESLRAFAPATQRSLGSGELVVVPAREVLIPQGLRMEDLGLDLEGLAGGRWEEELGMLLEGQWLPGFEFYAPLFNTGSLLDYVPPGGLVALEDPGEIASALGELVEKAQELRQERIDRGEMPSHFPAPNLSWPELQERMGAFPTLTLESFGEFPLSFSSPASFRGQWPEFLGEVRKRLQERDRVVLVTSQAPRLAELLEQQDILASPQESLPAPPPPGSIALLRGSVEGGLLAPGLALYSDLELFGFRKERRQPRKHPVRLHPSWLEVSPGDYVVHVDHGVARYGGLARLGGEEEEREALVLEYAEGDRLYVPTDQSDKVSRYLGPTGEPPALTRLGTQEWQRAKERVRQAAGDLARELLGLYAARELLPGFAFSPDSPWQQELEASFPYVETPDQLRAVLDVKEDMGKARPMDRLVCGDVGYGKTEVALRAAFKAIQDSRQVAVLVPTTVLAQQHFQTFTQRLAPFPVRVELLSRFRSPLEQREVVAGLRAGKVDIVIGTHRLLQKDVAFKDLGLLIIDEEQRFGVRHKELLKRVRQEVDVLTLSATPIPRTMHMALAGVRDMSTMETPPEERLPIKTYVAERDSRLIREALLRERERGGQAFFVHNRVQTIARVTRELQVLVPEARLAVAHGQMPEEELERVMLEFARGESDVLVCTTIIESGLDLPRVNTLIVDQADRLGLTQLYQLRGRVGRGSERAFAYFLYERGKRLTPQAIKRLETIYEATELGAGFRIALRDLEIRGAGNLLGPEQSGHVGAVGFDLYTRLLAEAVEEARATQRGEAPQPKALFPSLNLPLPAHIPKDYIPDEAQRLAVYHRLAGLEEPGEVAEIDRELRDRYGPVPLPAANLLYLVRVKALGARVGAEGIYAEEGQVVVKLREGVVLDRGRLRGLGVEVGTTQVRLRRAQGWPQALEQLLERLANP